MVGPKGTGLGRGKALCNIVATKTSYYSTGWAEMEVVCGAFYDAHSLIYILTYYVFCVSETFLLSDATYQKY